jgi:HK97 family phage prohead protease
MNKIEKFIPLTKIDTDLKVVSGFASTPDLDSDGEVIEVNALRRALPDYLEFPTIRRMHQLDPVGTTINAEVTELGLFISAKIVDSDAWEKIKAGVYKGFSIGGRILKRVENKITDLSLTEISLVDVPANRHAVITLYKVEKQNEDLIELFKLFMLRKYIEYAKKHTKEN